MASSKEMSRERESRRRLGNVVARLNGFEGLPPQPTYKPMQESLDKVTQCQDIFQEKCLKENEVFKDVFPVHETLKTEKLKYQSVKSLKSSISELHHRRQSYMDVRRQSTDKTPHHLEKVRVEPDLTDSNKDILIKFLQNPSPLMTKHMKSLQSSNSQAHCCHMVSRNTLKSPFCQHLELGQNSNKMIRSLRNRYVSPQNFHSAQSSTACRQDIQKTSSTWSDSEYESLPAKIVVLKPNIRRAREQHICETIPPTHFSYTSASNYEAKNIVDIHLTNSERYRPKVFDYQVELAVMKARKTREYCQRTIKRKKGRDNKAAGYAGDKSSSAEELEDIMTSHISLDLSNQHRLLVSDSIDLPVIGEVSNSLSKRFETAQKYQRPGSNKGGMLREIHVISDKDDRTGILNQPYRDNQLKRDYGFMCPPGSPGNGSLTVDYTVNLSRLKSVSGPYDALGVPESSMKLEIVEDVSTNIRTIMATNHRSNDVQVNHIEDNSIKESKANTCRTSQSSKSLIVQDDDHFTEVSDSQQKIKHIVSDALNVAALTSILDNVRDNQKQLPAEPPAAVEEVTSSTPKGDTKICNLDVLMLQEASTQEFKSAGPTTSPILEPISPVSLKGTEQPSPTSVLELPNVDASPSGVECFGRLSADLQGLRAQLQLLKLGLAEDSDEPQFAQISDSINDDSSPNTELTYDKESWDSSYVVDVLAESGFNGIEPQMFLTTQHSPDLPLELSVFKNLEKKYHEQKTTRLKSERRLLFDRINSGLLHIFDHYTNSSLWSQAARKKLVPISKDGLKDDLCKLLAGQEKIVDGACLSLTIDSDWLHFNSGIHDIWLDVETSLLDELVAELARAM